MAYENYNSPEDEFMFEEQAPDAPNVGRYYGLEDDFSGNWFQASRAYKDRAQQEYDKRALQMKQGYEKALMGMGEDASAEQKSKLRGMYESRSKLFKDQWRDSQQQQLNTMKAAYDKDMGIFQRRTREYEARKKQAFQRFQMEKARKRREALKAQAMKESEMLNMRRKFRMSPRQLEAERMRSLFDG
jgi:hypothetical protein